MIIPSQVSQAQVIFVNHSGGKDSQAMLAMLVRLGFMGKLVVVHSDLGDMEWEPMHGFIAANSFGLPCHVVKPREDFFELCHRYKRLPSGQARFCTSELKTRPIGDWIKAYMTEHGYTHAINAIGIRSQESLARSKKLPLQASKLSAPSKNRNVTEWYPIFDYSLEQVWSEIAQANQAPHVIYSKGFSRLSCVFCVFGRVNEHAMAKEARPALFDRMAKLERALGKTIRTRQVNGAKLPKYLDESYA